ncbi:MAG: hypothetical protein WC242_03100 [Candidatus Paceibacterota bacterium]|jgi:hypothetical protein
MKKALVAGLGLCMVLFAVACVGFTADGATQIGASLWSGLEVENAGNIGGYIGGQANVVVANHLAFDAQVEETFYSTTDLSAIFGLRGVFADWSMGVGGGFNAYDLEGNSPYCLGKADIWASTYAPGFFAKLYIDGIPRTEYGKVSIALDWRNKPVGFAGSYFFSNNPGGIYNETRGDLSASLFYPCSICIKSEYDCDFRLFAGARYANFDNLNIGNPYWSHTYGWLAGLRLIAFNITLKAELQGNYKTDPWVNNNFALKFVLNSSISF